MGEYFVHSEQMTVGYDGKPLIRDIEIRLNRGEILTLIGPNGAGKSTILKSLTRQLKLVGGTVYLDQKLMSQMSGKEVAQKLAVVTTERIRPELMTCEDIVAMKEDAKNVYVHPVLIDYIVELARMTRQEDNVSIGVSPRGTLGMLNAARAYAYVAGRDYAVPEDIKTLAPVVWAHRIVLQTGYMNMDNKEQIIEHVVNNTAVPTEDWKR